MKYLIIILLLCSCGTVNNKATIEWIENAEPPVICLGQGSNGVGEMTYTLIDGNGRIYHTGRITLYLPTDTIIHKP